MEIVVESVISKDIMRSILKTDASITIYANIQKNLLNIQAGKLLRSMDIYGYER